VIIVVDADRAEADLAAGTLACPCCGGRLRPWARAARRQIRLRDGSTRPLQPRRARCASCRGTQVLLPGWSLPRRADAVEVIGTALIAKEAGHGFRRIAADLDRSPWTVRAWLRRTRGAHPQRLRERAIGHVAALDRELLITETAPVTPIGAALSALGIAVAAYHRRLDRHADRWALIGVFTAGRLLAPP
jgi:hypothetical protein